jgi:hypothetical protein
MTKAELLAYIEDLHKKLISCKRGPVVIRARVVKLIKQAKEVR